MTDLDEALRALDLPEGRPIVTADTVARRVAQAEGRFAVVGARGSAGALAAARTICRTGRTLLYVTPDVATARRATDDLRFFLREAGDDSPLSSPSALLFAPSEVNPYADVHPERRSTMARIGALFHLAQNAPLGALVVPASALIRKVVPRAALTSGSIRVRTEDELDVSALSERLVASGYLRTPVVEDPGTYAVRGGLVDVWPSNAAAPVRIELYGDLVAELRRFDSETQRTQGTLTEIWLPPAREVVLTPQAAARAGELVRALCDSVNYPSTKTRRLVEDLQSAKLFFGSEGFLPAYYDLAPLTDYLPQDALLFVEQPPSAVRALREGLEAARTAEASRSEFPHFPVDALYASEPEIARWLEGRQGLALHTLGVAGGASDPIGALETVPLDAPTLATSDQVDLQRAGEVSRKAKGKYGALDPLASRLEAWSNAGVQVVLTARTPLLAERLATLLEHRGLSAPIGASGSAPVRVQIGELSRGLIAPAERRVFVTEEEIFGQRARRPSATRQSARTLADDLRALEPGDHVVHVDHGIGRYLGLETRSVAGVSVDLLVVEYLGGDKLFLPVHRMNQVQKYAGAEASPRLDRLGGQSFARTKSKARRRIREMADDLLRLYAERNAATKRPLGPVDDEYAALEATFPFEETRDQATAIADVMSDLESERVMDRVICGDVGFGKTEVALRAAFRNALAGRQTALLCPTTVLAQQHFLTFSKRLSDHPIEVRVLSRFQSKQEQADCVRGLKNGTVDIVVGTHRLLSKDVHFKTLGLVVIDEEQRFGVAHKERLKQLRASVDVLTLTATPIPRTLQLAVGGLRDLSMISTPPVERRAIRTITAQFDEQIVRDAVRRELERGGQVFYVYNRIEGLYERADRLAQLLPEARIAVGHGQLKASLLEKTMLQFVHGQHDVFVTTAIIESGLDIPRANTMIVDRADLFGLSQLYQLRGRVGRSSERAYCYLLVPPASKMTDEARHRVEALERYTDLGTGFHLASLDMQLRGTGDLLGAEQSGFVATVGFDLFCQMLEEATRELRGEAVIADLDPELTFDVSASLPDTYIEEIGVRLSLYKRLASARTESDVDAIGSEIEDRFGPAPLDARRLMDLMRLKVELRRFRALGCEANERSVTLHLAADTPLDPLRIRALVEQRKAAYRLTPDMKLTRTRTEKDAPGNGLSLAARALEELGDCLRPTT